MRCPIFPPTRYALTALCLAWLATGVAAQDPNATAAQAAARDWLALTDRGDAQASWSAAGKKFQSALPIASWVAALKKKRAPLGATTSRATFKSGFQKAFRGAPEGDYALIAYATNFAGRSMVHETVTLEREGDGKWRVIGYDIH